MNYQLFLPEWPSSNPEAQDSEKRRRGLEDILDGTFDALPNQSGPQGHTGLLVAWPTPKSPHHCYKPERQTWLPSMTKLASGVPAYYVGIWNDNLPTESELRRAYTQDGTLVAFNEEKWKLPTPKTVDARAVYNDDGSMRWEPIRKFSWMCDEAAKIADKLTQSGEYGAMYFEFQDNPQPQVEWLLKLLRVNYRIVPELAAYLELWTSRKKILETYLATLGLHVVTKDTTDGN